jgi:hypothetical protein
MARRSARSSRISFGTVFLVDGLGKGAATLEGARALALTTAEIQALRHSHAPQIRPLRSPSAAWWLVFLNVTAEWRALSAVIIDA